MDNEICERVGFVEVGYRYIACGFLAQSHDRAGLLREAWWDAVQAKVRQVPGCRQPGLLDVDGSNVSRREKHDATREFVEDDGALTCAKKPANHG